MSHVPMPDDFRLSVSPIGSEHNGIEKKSESAESQITHYRKTTEIKLKKDTRVAIVFVRALSSDKIVYKLFEIEKGQ